MKIVNDIRITKEGKKEIDKMLASPIVNQYHKTLLKGIKSGIPKNVSKSDCDILETIHHQYRGRLL